MLFIQLLFSAIILYAVYRFLKITAKVIKERKELDRLF